MGGGWTAFRLQRLGEWNEENCRVFPATAAIVRSLAIPLAVRGVMFAKQAPGTGVQVRLPFIWFHLCTRVTVASTHFVLTGRRRSRTRTGATSS